MQNMMQSSWQSEEFCSGNFEICFPDRPAFHPGVPRLPSVLDILLKTSTLDHEPLRGVDDLGSDHLPVVLELNTRPALCDLIFWVGNGLLTGDLEKAESLSMMQFENHETTLDQPIPTVLDESVSCCMDKIEAHVEPINSSLLTSPREVRQVIKELNNRKAPGDDGIRNTALKNATRKAVIGLTCIFLIVGN